MSSFVVVALALALGQTQPQTAPARPGPQAPAGAPAQQQVAPPQAPEPPAVPPQAAPQQPAQPPAGAITLDDALRIAGERSLDLQVLQARLRQADEISWKAWSGYLPKATVTGAWQAEQQIQFPIQALWPPNTPAPPPGYPTMVTVQPGSILQGQLEVTQTLVSLAQLYGIRQASATERAATLTIGNARRALFFGVAGAYYAAASLQQRVGVFEQLLEIALRQEKDARVRYQAGTIAKVGLLRAEIDRAGAEQDLKRLRNAFESARLALATLLDRAPDFDVVDPPPPPLAESPNPDELVRAALDKRLDVQAARAQVDAAHAQRDVALSRYLPNVAGFYRLQRANAAGAFGGKENWVLGLGLQWTILDGGLRESDVREGNAKIAEADASARRAEASARQEVLQALLDLDSARANAAKAKEQRDLAAENMRLVDVSYRAGASTAVELADATAALRNAEIGATSETLNAQLAALRVLQAAGEFEPGAKR